MADVPYETYTISPRPAGPASVVAVVLKGSDQVASFSERNERDAITTAQRWIEGLASNPPAPLFEEFTSTAPAATGWVRATTTDGTEVYLLATDIAP